MRRKNMILDIRSNNGGTTPVKLVSALVKRRTSGFKCLDTRQKTIEERMRFAWLHKGKKEQGYVIDPSSYNPAKRPYKGNIFVLVNQSTVSAAEDFAFPLKKSRRAKLIGIKTKGSNGNSLPYVFGKKIMFCVGVTQVRFPDGSRFEGVGIKPDIEVYPSIDDIRTENDRTHKN